MSQFAMKMPVIITLSGFHPYEENLEKLDAGSPRLGAYFFCQNDPKIGYVHLIKQKVCLLFIINISFHICVVIEVFGVGG